MFNRFCLKALLLAGLALPIVSCTNAGLSYITLSPTTASLTVGQSVQFTAWGYYGNAKNLSNKNITSEVTWAYTTTALTPCPVTPVIPGCYTAVAAGTTTVGITDPGFGGTVGATATVTITAGTGGGSNEPYTAVSIVPATQTIATGQTSQLIALVTTGTGVQKDMTSSVKWSSSNVGIASFGAVPGLATGMGPGTTTITATATNPDNSVVTGTATITVTPNSASEPLVSLAIVPAAQTLTAVNQTVGLVAIGTTSSGATVNLTNTPATIGTATIKAATWNSSVPTVAGINAATGVATAAGNGTTAITAQAVNPDGTVVTGTANITVNIAATTEPLVSLSIVPGSQTLTVANQTAGLTVIGTTATGTTVNLTNTPATIGTATIKAATWNSTVPTVASINAATGVATAAGNGTTAITAQAINPDGTVVTGTATITVNIPATPEPIASLAIVPGSQTLTALTQTASLIAIGTTSTGTTVDLTNRPATVGTNTILAATWTSSVGAVAQVNPSTGVVTPIGNGTTVITAEAVNPGDKTVVTAVATVTVSIPGTAEPLASLSIVPGTQTLTALNQTANLTAIGTTSSGTAVNLTNMSASVGTYTILAATWTSSVGAVAQVNPSTGVVTPIANGTTVITAQAVNPGDKTVVTAVATITVSIPGTAEPLASLSIVPGAQTFTSLTQTANLIALGTTSTGSTVNLTGASATVGQYTILAASWTSSVKAVAQVNPSTGVVTPIGNGTTVITAQAINPGDGSVVTAVASVTVNIPATPEVLASLSIVPGSQTLTSLTETADLIALGSTTATGGSVNLTGAGASINGVSIPAAQWYSSVPTVAKVGLNSGVVTPLTNGATAITATVVNSDGTTMVTAVAPVTVDISATPEPIASLAIVPGSQTLTSVGQTAGPVALGTTSTGTTVNLTGVSATVGGVTILPATWLSSNTAVASINASTGIVTAVANGTTVISAKIVNLPDNSVISAVATVTVSIPATPEPIASLAIVPASQTLTSVGQTAGPVALGTTSTGTTVNLTGVSATVGSVTIAPATWLSSNTGVATIDAGTGLITAVANGTTVITAKIVNLPDNSTVTGIATITVAITATPEPLISATVYPSSPSVGAPNLTSQLVDIGTFSVSPITEDVSAGLASRKITTNWSSSNPTVATVTTVCPATLTAMSCTISACPGTSNAGACTSCPTGSVAAALVPAAPASFCATLHPTTPVGLVTGLSQGTTAIMAVASNQDGSQVINSVPFSVTGGSTETYTALTIIPNILTVTSPAQQNQFIALATAGSSGLQYDITNQVIWKSNTPTVASICTAVAGVNPATPISCPTTPGLVTAASAGTSIISATWVNPDSTELVQQATYSVNIGPSPEPLISINVVPGDTTVSNKGMTQQYLAFGSFTTVPTYRDITDSVTWITLDPNLVSINSAGTPGEAAGLATAMGEEGLGVIYAEATNPDGTIVLSSPVTFTCQIPGVTPPICSQAVAPSLLATLTVFNAGSNSTNWLITAPSDTGVPNLIHCGPGSLLAGLGNSVCTGTYAAGTNVTITASLGGAALDNTFGGWTANCDTTVDTPNTAATCAFPNTATPSGLIGNQSAGALFYGLSLSCSSVTSGNVGVAFNSGAITVSDGKAPYTFSVVGTLPAGLVLAPSTGAVTGTPTASGAFSLTANDANGTNAGSTCAITIN
jgi:hypothetical protein